MSFVDLVSDLIPPQQSSEQHDRCCRFRLRSCSGPRCLSKPCADASQRAISVGDAVGLAPAFRNLYDDGASSGLLPYTLQATGRPQSATAKGLREGCLLSGELDDGFGMMPVVQAGHHYSASAPASS
jgi:hypothetical protein